MLSPVELDDQGTAERLAADQPQLRPGPDRTLVQESQHRGLPVGDASEAADLARLEGGQRNARRVADDELPVGDRIPVRVVLGVAERGGDALLELLGDVVLEHLGLVVDAIPGHAERVGEEGLEQAVMADHLEGDALTGLGQLDPVVRLVADQSEGVHALQHRRDRSRRYVEPLGQRGRADRPGIAGGQGVDRLRVILDRLVAPGAAAAPVAARFEGLLSH